MAHSIRYSILDDATDQPALWHLTSSSRIAAEVGSSEVHPAHTIDELRPHLADLLREGHVELFRFREPDSSALPLDNALAAVADDSNWNPETAETWYGVFITDSGLHELGVEREAYRRAE